jgi:geranylgeranylglycerol-phosphate geranylgeranyltransferase
MNKYTTTKIAYFAHQNNESLYEYFRIFMYYVKARTAPVYCFPFATLIAIILSSQGNINVFTAANAVIASYFLSLAVYIYNDLTDFEVDKVNKTNRPSTSGKVNKTQLAVIVSVISGIALLLTGLINFYALCIAVTYSMLGLIYSHPKFKLKDKFPLKTVTTAAGAGLLSLLGSATVPCANLPVIYITTSFSIFYFILSPLGDICDIKGDKAAGRRTFPIVLGMKPTLLIMLSVPITILVTTGVGHDILKMKILGIYAITATCFATIAFILRLNKRLDNINAIKSSRNKMRCLNIMVQTSLLFAFFV